MNQEQNNLNQNNFNMQGNNGIPENQPLNNMNQSLNQQTFNQSFVDNPASMNNNSVTQQFQQPMNNNTVTQQFVQNPQVSNDVMQNNGQTVNSVTQQFQQPMNNNPVTQQFVQNPQVSNDVMQNNGQTVNSVTQQFQQPMNQPFMNNNFNNQNTKNQKKNLKLLIGIGILIIVIIISGVLVVTLNTPTNNNSSETPNNNSSETPNNSSNNTSNDKTGDDSSELTPLNTYANIVNDVYMKVNNTYVEDKYNFAIRTTFKNDGNNDEILFTSSFGKDVIGYYYAYFLPKNVDIDNANEEDEIYESCYIRKIVRNDGNEITVSSSNGDTILKAGETLDAIIYCVISKERGYAEGVNPFIMEINVLSGSNAAYKYFDIRN